MDRPLDCNLIHFSEQSNDIMGRLQQYSKFCLFALSLIFFAMSQHCSNAQEAPAQSTASTPSQTTRSTQQGFWTRLGHAYIGDWTASSSNLPVAPAPQKHARPAQLSAISFNRLAHRWDPRHRRTRLPDLYAHAGRQQEREPLQNLRLV